MAPEAVKDRRRATCKPNQIGGIHDSSLAELRRNSTSVWLRYRGRLKARGRKSMGALQVHYGLV
jgi:hypothetical protein